jgi:hypothetical protein
MTNALKQIVNYEKLKILTPFEGVCFGHALLKVCQHATSNEKVSSGLQHVSINSIQSSIEACQKKSRKRKVEWKKGFFGYKFATTKAKHTNEDKVCIQSENVVTSP